MQRERIYKQKHCILSHLTLYCAHTKLLWEGGNKLIFLDPIKILHSSSQQQQQTPPPKKKTKNQKPKWSKFISINKHKVMIPVQAGKLMHLC